MVRKIININFKKSFKMSVTPISGCSGFAAPKTKNFEAFF